MNPLNVLRGGSLMTPVEELKREDDAVLLDRAGRFRVKLDAAGGPASVTLDGYLGRLITYRPGLDMAALPATALITAPCDMSMRVGIELPQESGPGREGPGVGRRGYRQLESGGGRINKKK